MAEVGDQAAGGARSAPVAMVARVTVPGPSLTGNAHFFVLF
jgi:hypothetical protein